MKLNYIRDWRTFKRWFYWYRLRLSSIGSGHEKLKKPKKMKESEQTAYQIFIRVLHDPGSKLYYDLQTQESYLRSEDSTIFLFLEAENIKIINSVYGYDVHISRDLEQYLLEKFRREMAIRRKRFKDEALSRVEHSLESTLEKLINKTHD